IDYAKFERPLNCFVFENSLEYTFVLSKTNTSKKLTTNIVKYLKENTQIKNQVEIFPKNEQELEQIIKEIQAENQVKTFIDLTNCKTPQEAQLEIQKQELIIMKK
ncbi:MAG: hypothetical protein Q7K42_00165, partial [Candidatus Diapherotrites archaeon]|nr:hypothetical protein [Candidatus Diapherotrites archaeon]